jgi:hypothetical protein
MSDHAIPLPHDAPVRPTTAHRSAFPDRCAETERGLALWARNEGRILSPFTFGSTYEAFATPLTGIRSLQLTRYDPGSAAYRYHSAANAAHEGAFARTDRSAFVRYGHDNPMCDLRQWDGDEHRREVAALFETADVVHVHMDYATLDNGVSRWPDRARQMLVRHYHGSQPKNTTDEPFVQNAIDRDLGAVQIGARLYHNRFSPGMYWLPIPMPVADYEKLAAMHWRPLDARKTRAFRIAHSPTHARIKGTVVIETAVLDMQNEGLNVELVMINGKSHAEALALKATCDVTFDSFWLGIQGSGLEAACMNQPVVAGDADVRDEYRRETGECPYTFVEGYDGLREALTRLFLDAEFYARERDRVAAYVREYHSYAAVGDRYWSIITRERRARGYAP